MSEFKVTDDLRKILEETTEKYHKVQGEASSKKLKIRGQGTPLGDELAPLLHKRAESYESQGGGSTWFKAFSLEEDNVVGTFMNPEKDERFFRAISTFRVFFKVTEDTAFVRVEVTAKPNPFFDATKFHREVDLSTGKTVSLSKIGFKDNKRKWPSFFDPFEIEDIPEAIMASWAEAIWTSYSKEVQVIMK